MEKVIILGCGPAGLTAGLYAARAGLHPTIIGGPLPGGLLTQTGDVENFPGFPDGINGYELMDRMQQQAEKFGAAVTDGTLERVELNSESGHKLFLAGGSVMECEALIIATGASPRWLGIESEQRLRTHGVSACATCDGAFFRNVPVVVAGGGDSAMEESMILTRFASEVHIVHRRTEFRASKIMADRVLANPKIRVHWNSVVEEILGANHVEGVRIRNTETGMEETIVASAFFAALGHIPNTAPFRGILPMSEQGFLQPAPDTTFSGFQGVFAAGDCADSVYRQASTAAAAGCRAALEAIRMFERKQA